LLPLSAEEKRSLMESARRYHAALAGSPAEEYLLGRGFDLDTATRFRLGYVADPLTGEEQYAGRLAIPSLGLGDIPYALRFRALRDEQPRYLGKTGETRLYNVRALHQADDVICITEGELDCVTLEMCGLHSVGVTGANSWKRHHARLFAGFSTVYVFGDGDNAGKQFAQKVCDSVLTAVPVRMGEGMDVSDVFQRDGRDGVLALLEGKR
jgi:DNA primase